MKPESSFRPSTDQELRPSKFSIKGNPRWYYRTSMVLVFGGLLSTSIRGFLHEQYSVGLLMFGFAVLVFTALGSVDDMFNPQTFEVSRAATVLRMGWLLFAVVCPFLWFVV